MMDFKKYTCSDFVVPYRVLSEIEGRAGEMRGGEGIFTSKKMAHKNAFYGIHVPDGVIRQ